MVRKGCVCSQRAVLSRVALCPPLLFSLYINDMGREISEGIDGAVTGDRVNGVSHTMYADDLGLTTNDPGEMQKMLVCMPREKG